MSSTRLDTTPNTDVLHFITEQFGTADTALAGDTSAKLNQLDDFVREIPKIPVGKDEDRIEQVVEEASEAGGVPGKLARTRKTMTRVFDALAALSPNAETLFPGDVVKAGKVSGGELSAVSAPLAGSTLTLSGLQFAKNGAEYTRRIRETTAAAVQEAVTSLLDQGDAATTAGLLYSYFRSYSAEQLAVGLGAGYSSIGFSADLRAKFDQLTTNSVFVVKLVQPYYTVSVAPKDRPSLFFKSGTGVDQLKPSMGPGNPPAYVSSVKYGRMLLFVVRSTASAESLELAIRASFGGFVASGQVSVDVATRRVLNTADMSLMVLGGPAGPTVSAIAKPGKELTDSLGDLLLAGMEYSRQSPGAPIAYTLRYVADNEVAQSTLVAPYTEDTWGPYRWTRIWAEGYTFGDDKRPDVTIEITISKNGRVLATGGIGNIRLYESQAWNTPLDMLGQILTGRDLNGSSCRIVMHGDDDDWRMNYQIRGQLENGQLFELGGHGTEHELNDRQPLQDPLPGVFGS